MLTLRVEYILYCSAPTASQLIPSSSSTGFVKKRNGKILSAYKSTYKRHGTLNLFGALEVHTGKVTGKITEEKKRRMAAKT